MRFRECCSKYTNIYSGGKSHWYGSWKCHVTEYDTFFIIGGGRGEDSANYIRRHNPNARIIVYYNNTLDENGRNNPRNFTSVDCEFYTFDHKDAKKYNIIQKDYYYSCYNEVKKYDSKDIKYDIFFVGLDKGRLHKLIKLPKMLSMCECLFYVVKQRSFKYSMEEENYLSDKLMSYDDVMSIISESRCILELREEGQSGITLRPIEALYFRKKLITSDEDIKKYPWYNSDNIFILKDDTTSEEIERFLHKEYHQLPDSMYTMYNPEQWLESFF